MFRIKKERKRDVRKKRMPAERKGRKEGRRRVKSN